MKGIVYEIYSDSHPDIRYVGSTIQTLEKRWQGHKKHFKEEREGKPVICKYFEEFGIDNFQIRVIKEYDIVDKKHLLAYEQLWINKLKSINLKKNLVLTKKIRQMQKKEYREENKESISEKKKLYREENKESISEKHKLYREENKESICEKKKLYYENNREHILEQKARLYICPCDLSKEIRYGEKARHERTKKHQKYLQSLEEKKE